VVSSEAHLSNDKSGVYSEFQTTVTDVLKNSSGLSITPGSLISLERAGGAVLYANGHRQIYAIAGQNMPLVKRRYVFFTSCAGIDQNCRIITAYELKDNRVNPLDDVDTFEVYKAVGESNFLNSLRSAITPHNGEAR
jgi:hypothetical protein